MCRDLLSRPFLVGGCISTNADGMHNICLLACKASEKL